MTGQPTIFNFNAHAVRVVLRDGDPWFVASDVANVLEYRDAANMTRILDDDEKGTHIMSTLGGNQEVTIISESGLYHAIIKSRKPQAKPFRKWVTAEVLPAIRKTGRYALPQVDAPEDAASVPIITLVEGVPTTTSLDIAAFFGRTHIHVLQAIDDVLLQLGTLDAVGTACKRNFMRETYTLPATGKQRHRMFRLTRDGFSLLRFRKAALPGRIAYLNAFGQVSNGLPILSYSTPDERLHRLFDQYPATFPKPHELPKFSKLSEEARQEVNAAYARSVMRFDEVRACQQQLTRYVADWKLDFQRVNALIPKAIPTLPGSRKPRKRNA